MKRYNGHTSILLLLLISIFILSACSRKLLEAVARHKLHDEWLYLHRNGHYTIKKTFFGLLKMEDNRKGRYLLSGDTVYFVNRTSRNNYALLGYAVTDSAKERLQVRMTDSTRDMDMTIQSLDPGFYNMVLQRQKRYE